MRKPKVARGSDWLNANNDVIDSGGFFAVALLLVVVFIIILFISLVCFCFV